MLRRKDGTAFPAAQIHFFVFVAFFVVSFFVSFFGAAFVAPQPFTPQAIVSPPLQPIICKRKILVNNNVAGLRY
jgi:hypothetical protein